MKTYKVIFAKNRIIDCIEIHITTYKIPHCEEYKGEITFILVNADNESQARSIAKYMALEYLQKKTA